MDKHAMERISSVAGGEREGVETRKGVEKMAAGDGDGGRLAFLSGSQFSESFLPEKTHHAPASTTHDGTRRRLCMR